jgi:hypothetical protein
MGMIWHLTYKKKNIIQVVLGLKIIFIITGKVINLQPREDLRLVA